MNHQDSPPPPPPPPPRISRISPLPRAPRDTLLRALGRREREREIRHDPRWDRLSEEALTAAEEEALRCESGAVPLGAALFEAFAPLDEGAQDRIAGKTALALEAQRAAVLRAAGQSDVRPRGAFPRAVVGGAGRSSPRRVLSAAAVLAVAAVALGVCIGLQRPLPAQIAEQSPPVAPPLPAPDYQLEVTGGDVPHAVRGPASTSPSRAAAGPTLLGSGASLAVTLRPARPVDAPVAMVACLVRAATGPGTPQGPPRPGQARPWAVSWERSEQGSFHTAGTRETLFPGEPPGDLTLFFAVRREGPLPACEALPGAAAPLRHRIQLL